METCSLQDPAAAGLAAPISRFGYLLASFLLFLLLGFLLLSSLLARLPPCVLHNWPFLSFRPQPMSRLFQKGLP